MANASEIAQWMLQKLEESKELPQDDAAFYIERHFGKQFVYENENGDTAISKEVLREFRKLTEGIVVWERAERCWRKGNQTDPEGTRQVD